MSFWRRLSAAAQALFQAEGGAPDGGPDDGPPAPDVDFTIAVIALGAKIAKADGAVTHDERATFLQVFRPAEEDLDDVMRVFALAQRTTLGFDSYAQRLARRWRAYPGILEDVLDGLFAVAAADGAVTPEELAQLARAAEIFGISDQELRRIRASWVGHDPGDPYILLGVDEDVDEDALKRAYRRAAAENHPDAVRARGLPEAAERLANAKMAVINAAYRRIRLDRGWEHAGGD